MDYCFSDPRVKDPAFPTPNPAQPMTDIDFEFSHEEIIKAIEEVKPRAASGPDGKVDTNPNTKELQILWIGSKWQSLST